MELRELNADEKLALVCLVRAVILADGEVTTAEVEELQTIVEALGAETYEALLLEADKRFPTEEAGRKFLAGIGRQEAREIIFGNVMQIALSDMVDQSESELLDWLTETWQVKAIFDAPE